MQQKTIVKLVDRYLKGIASEAETKVVEGFIEDLKNNNVKRLSPEEERTTDDLLLKQLYAQLHSNKKGLLVSMSRGWKVAISVAAVIILIAGIWLVVSTKNAANAPAEVAQKDINAPGSNRAMITLADGSKVYLDSAGNGTLATQGNTSLIKTADGKIVYDVTLRQAQGDIVYNTLSNPRGSKVIDMQLSDGSHVWLNAGSSVKYPVAFVGNERKVEITGEAYFEVAHDKTKPFYVTKGDVSVQVLGTHFNVNAYDDEENLKVTLLEGSVNVSSRLSALAVKLKPGEQAVLNQANPKISRIEVQTNVDTDEVMAWKNGMFLLDNTDLPTIMRQISRWYDVRIVYESKVPATKFVGGVSKNLPLSKVLELLKSNGIETELEGKTLKVK